MTVAALAALLSAQPVDTSTAATYQAAAILWRQRAKDERSAHQTTQAKLQATIASLGECQARTEVERVERVSRTSRTWLAVGAGVAGLGAGVGVAGLATGEERAALGGLVGVLVGGLLGSVSFFLF